MGRGVGDERGAHDAPMRASSGILGNARVQPTPLDLGSDGRQPPLRRFVMFEVVTGHAAVIMRCV